jgi:hypothetical protein
MNPFSQNPAQAPAPAPHKHAPVVAPVTVHPAAAVVHPQMATWGQQPMQAMMQNPVIMQQLMQNPVAMQQFMLMMQQQAANQPGAAGTHAVPQAQISQQPAAAQPNTFQDFNPFAAAPVKPAAVPAHAPAPAPAAFNPFAPAAPAAAAPAPAASFNPFA